MKKIYFAGGCFWGTEHFFKQIEGVETTQVGYANGNTPNPTYEKVCTDKTGYAETVCVAYDEDIVSLEFLVNMYFCAIDPTTLNRQGNDIGSQYRTGVYYTEETQKEDIEKVFSEQQRLLPSRILVEVEPLHNFFSAEEYHQDYLEKNPQGYCHLPAALFEYARKVKVKK